MIKTCENCKTTFKTNDSRRKACSNACGNVLRKTTQLVSKDSHPSVPNLTKLAPFTPPSAVNLPPPEELPAPYAKRVHDMWAALTSNGDMPTRIA